LEIIEILSKGRGYEIRIFYRLPFMLALPLLPLYRSGVPGCDTVIKLHAIELVFEMVLEQPFVYNYTINFHQLNNEP
jgi:hypothetical protein